MPQHSWFRLLRVRSPLLAQSLLFSSPAGTKMFQFPAFAPNLTVEYPAFNGMGCPIRTSADQRLFAPPRSFSQLITSFFASESQGIHPALLLTFLFHASQILETLIPNTLLARCLSFCIVQYHYLPYTLLYSFLSCFSICQRPQSLSSCLAGKSTRSL
jgi:hypothetical protein